MKNKMPTHQKTRIRTELRIHRQDGTVECKTIFADATFCRNGKTRSVWADKHDNIRGLGSFEVKVPEVYEVEWKEANSPCPFNGMTAQEWVRRCQTYYQNSITVKRGKFVNLSSVTSFPYRVVSSVIIHRTGKHEVLD